MAPAPVLTSICGCAQHWKPPRSKGKKFHRRCVAGIWSKRLRQCKTNNELRKMRMNKTMITVAAIAGTILLACTVLVGAVISASNAEVDLRTAIKAKQEDNKNEMDGMWKTISQAAQVTEAQKKALLEIFNGHAHERTGNGDGGAIIKWVQESIPTVDPAVWINLQNVITAKRDGFVFRQKELLDLSRAHNRILQRFPSGIILSILGRQQIPVTIITSTRTEKAFGSGKDDEVSVFQK